MGDSHGPARGRSVLFLINDAPFFLAHRLEIARAAKRAGYSVHVATSASPDVARIVDAGFTWHPVRIVRASLNPAREAQSFADIVRLYRRVAPDLVYHVTPKPLLYGTIAARLLRVPRVVNVVAGLGYVHGDSAPRWLQAAGRQAYRAGLRHPRMRVIFENSDDQRVFITRVGIRPDQTVLIRGAGVDMTEFSPVPARNTPPVVVVLASRLLYPKGVAEFVEAARRLRAHGAAVRMVVAGDPDPSNPTSIPAAQIAQWASEGIVEFLGRRTDMPAMLAGADIVCLPSYYPEGVPRVLIEAAACGRPAITTNTPGCREIVVDGVTGLLVPPRDVDALVAAIDRLAADPARRATYGAAARIHAVEHFSLETVLASTLAVFEELFQC